MACERAHDKSGCVLRVQEANASGPADGLPPVDVPGGDALRNASPTSDGRSPRCAAQGLMRQHNPHEVQEIGSNGVKVSLQREGTAQCVRYEFSMKVTYTNRTTHLFCMQHMQATDA